MEPSEATAKETTVLRAVKPLRYERRFTKPGQDPFKSIEWGRRDAEAGSGESRFFQADVEAPVSWSDSSVGIVAKLYFATVDGVREDSVRQVITRVVGKIVVEMRRHGYFSDDNHLDVMPDIKGFWSEDAIVFHDELVYLLLHQYVTFNSPVWFNFGVPGRLQCGSACFLLSVEDHMNSGPETPTGEGDAITDWWAKEAKIFKMGAGSGVNVSNIRGSMEPLSTGGMASGPVAYIRPSDAGAGTLKSGGAHRRAAKLVRLDADHPDIVDFIQCKVREDERMRALQAAGFNLDPMSPEGERNIAECTSFQNQNMSVGVTDEFMRQAAEQPERDAWPLTARKTRGTVETVNAAGLLWMISEAAHKCADPGLQFHDEINRWHTTPSLGPITTSNPCAETMLNDNSSCNLGTLNIGRFVADTEGKGIDVDDFRHAVDIMITAMDSTCSWTDLPTEQITDNTRKLRQLGLGFTNLGASLMMMGMPYDSDRARDFAAGMCALMTGRAYRRSVEIARSLGAFEHYTANKPVMLGVIKQHRSMLPNSAADGTLWWAAMDDWADASRKGEKHGYRNSQVTLVQPGGTTSFMVGADTTGIEPAFSLVSYKKLASSGMMKIINGAVSTSLQSLGYSDLVVAKVSDALHKDEGLSDVEEIDRSHLGIFQTAVGEDPISPIAHVAMVAAVQPFLSQSVSKTINVTESATPADIRELYIEAWRRGCKAISVYRDGSKATQVLSMKGSETPAAPLERRDRWRMPRVRNSITSKFSIDGHEGYLTAGMHENGDLGEIFLNGIGKDGSTLRGMMDAWAIAISTGLQYGVPLEAFARKYAHVRFEPYGATNDPAVPSATSLPDYIMRSLASMFLDADACEELGVLTPEVKERKTQALDEGVAISVSQPAAVDLGVACRGCGSLMVRSGNCWSCPGCFATTGCG